MSHRELTEAKEYLKRNSYQADFHENGHLIVQDPVHRIDVMSGTLKLDGYKKVAIRDAAAAFRFVSERS